MTLDPSDHARLEELTQRALVATEAMSRTIKALAEAEVEGHSADHRVQVRVTAGGQILELRLRDGALTRYDSAALGELVTRTVRETQLRARSAFESEVAAVESSEIDEAAQAVWEIWRD